MTSNIGAEKLTQEKKLGFGNSGTLEENKIIMNELKREFKPEFINRIDNIVVFNKLTNNDLIKILEIILRDLNKRIEDKKIKLKITEDVKQDIVNNKIDLNYGARQLKRKVQEILENVIAKEMVKGNLKEGNIIEFYIAENQIEHRIKN